MPISLKRPQAGGRKVLVAGNWKMNKTYGEAVQLAQLVSDRLKRGWKDDVEVVLCPPATALRGVSNVFAFDKSYAKVGGQDCSAHDSGAYTGDISAPMLADLDCAWCIVGHSERRSLLGETDADVARKCAALARAGVAPLLCVGEPVEVYDAGGTLDFVSAQVRAALDGVDLGDVDLAVGYEPVWAIGSGRVPAPEEVQDVARAVRAALAQACGEERARRTRVLYGGSVRAANAPAFLEGDDVDGLLVGGASLKAPEFLEIVGGAARV